MNQLHKPSEASFLNDAFDLPVSHYIHWIQNRKVADALTLFKSETHIRRTARLDLVAWVQYICAFGCNGPSDDAWAQLFSACRLIPTLRPGNPFLREHEIAILLAYAKIKPDCGDSMTTSQLVKHRIRPAVLGRSVARTPGILHHIHHKFEHWALGPFTNIFFSLYISLFKPAVFETPNYQSSAILSYLGDTIRQNANTQTNILLKSWSTIVTALLDIDPNTISSRVLLFKKTLQSQRNFVYQQIYVILSEHCLSHALPLPQSRRPTDHYTPSSQNCAPIPYFIYRTHPESVLSSKSAVEPQDLCNAHIIVCELHKPLKSTQIALEFVESKNSTTKHVTNLRSKILSSSSNKYLLIGTNPSKMIPIEVSGTAFAHTCRALRLNLKVRVTPPKLQQLAPQIELVTIDSAKWVKWNSPNRECCQKDNHAIRNHSELTRNEHQNGTQFESCGEYVAFSKNIIRREIVPLNTQIMSHEMMVRVPRHMLHKNFPDSKSGEIALDGLSTIIAAAGADNEAKRVSYITGGFEAEMKDNETENFPRQCWIQWHAGAVLTFVMAGGADCSPANIGKNGMHVAKTNKC